MRIVMVHRRIGSARLVTSIAADKWARACVGAATILVCWSTHALGDAYQLWGGAAINEWEDAAHAIVISDLSGC